MLNLNFDDMMKNAESLGFSPNKQNYNDERFWKISRNDKEEGLAKIRIIPSFVKGILLPFVKVMEHNINIQVGDKKKFYSKESPSSIKLPCAVSDLYRELGKFGTEPALELQEKIRRSTKFIANIYIVTDPLKPDNNGHFKLWKYGTKLSDKFLGAANPSAEDIAMGTKPINVLDPINGSNITLKQKKSGGFFNYDDTVIDVPAPVKDFSNNEEMVSWVKDNSIDLTEWSEEEHYITYNKQIEELKRLFDGTTYEDLLKSLGSFIYKSEEKGTISDSSAEKNIEKPITSDGIPDMSDTDIPVETKQETQGVDDSELSFLNGL
jgi:hypothetical protein